MSNYNGLEFQDIPLSAIKTDGLDRKELGDLASLRHSIRENGLLQPIGVQEWGAEYRLIFGLRRLTCIRKLAREGGPKTITAVILPASLTMTEAKKLEYAENTQRKRMTPFEEISMKRKLYEWGIKRHGKKTARSGTGWSGVEVAGVLGEKPRTTQADIQMALALTKMSPAEQEKAKKARTKLEIRAMIQNARSIVGRVSALNRAENGKTEEGTRRLLDSLREENFFLGVRQLPTRAFSLALVSYTPEWKLVLHECKRVLRPDSYLILFHPFWVAEGLLSATPKKDYRYAGSPALWVREQGKTASPAYDLAHAYECFSVLALGERPIQKKGRLNIFHFPEVPPRKKKHPEQRPLELLMEILATFAAPGDHVLVPFTKTGGPLLAAAKLGMSVVGFGSGEEKEIFTQRVMEEL